jgi:Ni/Fe-hydrogenase subunit HybB-like protein
MGLTFASSYYQAPYGTWLLDRRAWHRRHPALHPLLCPRCRRNYGILALAMLLNCFGVTMNRFVMTIQALAIPVLPFEKFIAYLPSWQEWGISAA